ncbi:MAG: hypothetical protein IJ021_06780 [Clostridia bacterium]|nr:hypothetical protein [Clostridia bacterium]
MKKIISLILITLLMFSFVSCKDNNEISEYKNDRYIYAIVPTTEGYKTLIKFDVVEKTAVTACPDPLCEHGRSCPVSGMSNCSVTDNCIYIERGDISTGKSVYVYDLAKNEISLFVKCKQISTPQKGPNGLVYFTISQIEYNDEGLAEKEIFHLYCRNEKTGELKRLTTEPLAGFAHLPNYAEDKLIWTLSGEPGYWSTDIDFQNRQPYEIPRADYMFEFDTIYTNTLRHEVYRINNITGEKSLIFKDAASFRYLGNYPNYYAALYKPMVAVGEDEELEYIHTGEIAYIDLYDTSKTFIWDVPEDISVPNIYNEVRNPRRVNDYHGFDCQQYETDEQGNLYQLHGIFVVNPTTKEAFPIIYEGSRRLIRSAE